MSENTGTTRARCPRCEGELLATDRFCRGCGADVLWVSRPGGVGRRIPRALEVEQFQEPGDRAATATLALAAPVQMAVRYYLRRVAEPEYRNQLLGSAIRVSPTQFPHLHRLARFCERVLRTAPVEVYVTTGAQVAAMAFGSGTTDVILLDSLRVAGLNEEELLFLLGSQLGHVKADHVLYLTVGRTMTAALRGVPGVGTSLSSMATYAMVPWQRQAVLTADRAGLLCCQDLAVAARTLVKLSFVGVDPGRFDIREFLEQTGRMQGSGDWGDAWKETPALGRRLHALHDFYRSEDWDRIFEGAWDPTAPRFLCYFCPGGGSPSTLAEPLVSLRCDECERDLMVEEVPCPRCCASIPVDARAGLGNLVCEVCKTAYPDSIPGHRLRLQDPPEICEQSAYRVLDLPPTARTARIRRAFRERMAPLGEALPEPGRPHPAQEKIRLYAAYKQLIDPSRRARHDRMLEHARDLVEQAEPGKLPLGRCPACATPTLGAYCGGCGHPLRDPAPREACDDLLAFLAGELSALAAEDLGELIEAPGGVFELAFHQAGRSYLFTARPALDRPGALRALLRGASDVVALAGWSSTPRFYVLVEGTLDEELLARTVTEYARLPGGGAPALTVVRELADGRLQSVAVADGHPVCEEHADRRSLLEEILGLRIRRAS